jgi:hypothetical protein
LCTPAPQPQPDVTEHETTGAHAFGMGRHAQELEQGLEPALAQDDAEGVSAPLDLNPLRAAGWIFRDGDCIALERQNQELGSSNVADR